MKRLSEIRFKWMPFNKAKNIHFISLPHSISISECMLCYISNLISVRDTTETKAVYSLKSVHPYNIKYVSQTGRLI